MLDNSLKSLVPAERFELPTNGLQNRCSTAELSRHGDVMVVHQPSQRDLKDGARPDRRDEVAGNGHPVQLWPLLAAVPRSPGPPASPSAKRDPEPCNKYP